MADIKDETIYSDISYINNLIKNNIKSIESEGYGLIDFKNINYGTRYKFIKGDDICSFTIYYSDKKGITFVKDKSIEEKNFQSLIRLLKYNNEKVEKRVSFSKWIGTDEAGKGDYFGPLVVSGFFVENTEIDYLLELGVKDSKKLTDKKIEEIYETLVEKYGGNISVRLMMPSEYNKAISDYKNKKLTLNDLLGKLHSEVIIELYNKHNGVEGIITDQFTHQDKVHYLIKDSVNAVYIQRTKAEDDIAVAAASIISRALFLRSIEEIKEKYKFNFIKGASAQVVTTAIEFCNIYGKEGLKNVAKTHFKTTNEILSML